MIQFLHYQSAAAKMQPRWQSYLEYLHKMLRKVISILSSGHFSRIALLNQCTSDPAIEGHVCDYKYQSFVYFYTYAVEFTKRYKCLWAELLLGAYLTTDVRRRENVPLESHTYNFHSNKSKHKSCVGITRGVMPVLWLRLFYNLHYWVVTCQTLVNLLFFPL